MVQGVVKATQTGILWSQAQVLLGPPRSTRGDFRYEFTHHPYTIPTPPLHDGFGKYAQN